MAYTIVSDICEGVADCVPACPVACIAPGNGANQKGTPWYWIDFGVCIDCGVCLTVCPVTGQSYRMNALIYKRRLKTIFSDRIKRQARVTLLPMVSAKAPSNRLIPAISFISSLPSVGTIYPTKYHQNPLIDIYIPLN